MEPGADLPGHRHETAEQSYVLEGDAVVGGRVLEAGDYYRVEAGTSHGVSQTRTGCAFLVLASTVEAFE